MSDVWYEIEWRILRRFPPFNLLLAILDFVKFRKGLYTYFVCVEHENGYRTWFRKEVFCRNGRK